MVKRSLLAMMVLLCSAALSSAAQSTSTPPADAQDSTTAASSQAAPNDGTTKLVVHQGISQGLLIHKVQPQYPKDARKKGIQGMVVLQALIGKDGTIRNLHVISGPPELTTSALKAVQQWVYKPYLLDGKAVEVETTINVNYAMQP